MHYDHYAHHDSYDHGDYDHHHDFEPGDYHGYGEYNHFQPAFHNHDYYEHNHFNPDFHTHDHGYHDSHDGIYHDHEGPDFNMHDQGYHPHDIHDESYDQGHYGHYMHDLTDPGLLDRFHLDHHTHSPLGNSVVFAGGYHGGWHGRDPLPYHNSWHNPSMDAHHYGHGYSQMLHRAGLHDKVELQEHEHNLPDHTIFHPLDNNGVILSPPKDAFDGSFNPELPYLSQHVSHIEDEFNNEPMRTGGLVRVPANVHQDSFLPSHPVFNAGSPILNTFAPHNIDVPVEVSSRKHLETGFHDGEPPTFKPENLMSEINKESLGYVSSLKSFYGEKLTPTANEQLLHAKDQTPSSDNRQLEWDMMRKKHHLLVNAPSSSEGAKGNPITEVLNTATADDKTAQSQKEFDSIMSKVASVPTPELKDLPPMKQFPALRSFQDSNDTDENDTSASASDESGKNLLDKENSAAMDSTKTKAALIAAGLVGLKLLGPDKVGSFELGETKQNVQSLPDDVKSDGFTHTAKDLEIIRKKKALNKMISSETAHNKEMVLVPLASGKNIENATKGLEKAHPLPNVTKLAPDLSEKGNVDLKNHTVLTEKLIATNEDNLYIKKNGSYRGASTEKSGNKSHDDINSNSTNPVIKSSTNDSLTADSKIDLSNNVSTLDLQQNSSRKSEENAVTSNATAVTKKEPNNEETASNISALIIASLNKTVTDLKAEDAYASIGVGHSKDLSSAHYEKSNQQISDTSLKSLPDTMVKDDIQNSDRKQLDTSSKLDDKTSPNLESTSHATSDTSLSLRQNNNQGDSPVLKENHKDGFGSISSSSDVNEEIANKIFHGIRQHMPVLSKQLEETALLSKGDQQRQPNAMLDVGENNGQWTYSAKDLEYIRNKHKPFNTKLDVGKGNGQWTYSAKDLEYVRNKQALKKSNSYLGKKVKVDNVLNYDALHQKSKSDHVLDDDNNVSLPNARINGILENNEIRNKDNSDQRQVVAIEPLNEQNLESNKVIHDTSSLSKLSRAFFKIHEGLEELSENLKVKERISQPLNAELVSNSLVQDEHNGELDNPHHHLNHLEHECVKRNSDEKCSPRLKNDNINDKEDSDNNSNNSGASEDGKENIKEGKTDQNKESQELHKSKDSNSLAAVAANEEKPASKETSMDSTKTTESSSAVNDVANKIKDVLDKSLQTSSSSIDDNKDDKDDNKRALELKKVMVIPIYSVPQKAKDDIVKVKETTNKDTNSAKVSKNDQGTDPENKNSAATDPSDSGDAGEDNDVRKEADSPESSSKQTEQEDSIQSKQSKPDDKKSGNAMQSTTTNDPTSDEIVPVKVDTGKIPGYEFLNYPVTYQYNDNIRTFSPGDIQTEKEITATAKGHVFGDNKEEDKSLVKHKPLRKHKRRHSKIVAMGVTSPRVISPKSGIHPK